MSQQPERNWRRGFWSLFVTQFQETFSDNAYKFLLISFIIAMPLTTGQRDSFVFVVGALFAIPFIRTCFRNTNRSDPRSRSHEEISCELYP